jgi:hypothetical protein
MTSTMHPDTVLEALLARKPRAQRVKNLMLLHSVCAAQNASKAEISIATVGKLVEAAGGMKARALYNAASEDYRTLIEAWRTVSGPTKSPSVEARQTRDDEWLKRIDDPAVRSLVQAAFIERDKLRMELNLLKSVTHITVDRRPVQVLPADSRPALSLGGLQLTSSERGALEHAVSDEHLRDEGWSEGKHGEVFNELGRRVFEAGFTKAIRKVLRFAEGK